MIVQRFKSIEMNNNQRRSSDDNVESKTKSKYATKLRIEVRPINAWRPLEIEATQQIYNFNFRSSSSRNGTLRFVFFFFVSSFDILWRRESNAAWVASN